MSRNFRSVFLIPYIATCLFLIFGCRAGTTTSTPIQVQQATQTALQTIISLPSVTSVPTRTPNMITETPMLTPPSPFSISSLETLNTPSSVDFCEHIPSPEILRDNKNLSIVSGRFSLCIWTTWQRLVKPVIDLDQGTLVAADDPKGDIALAMSHQGLDGIVRYYVIGLNSAHIDELGTNNLSYEECNKLLESLDKDDPGILNVREGAVACVMTTENQIALIRVDNIYPLETQAAGFSFALLRR